MAAPADRLGSVDRALRLLVLLQRRESVRVTEAAEELGVAASTAHRLLTMLRAHDFAVQDGSRVYRPGPALAAIAPATSRDALLTTAAHPHLRDLARGTGETVHLMVLEGSGTRFVDGVEGSFALRVASRIGLILPAHVTSGGKVLLAELSREQLGELYPRGLPLTQDAAGPKVDVLTRELTAVRRRGYAVNIEESEQGVNAIGTAVRDRAGRAIAAVVVAAPSLRVPRRSLTGMLEPLHASAVAISTALQAENSGDRAGREE